LPSTGIGSLSAREAEGQTNISAGEKEAHKLLQPADKTLKTMAIEFAEYQVCVDVFITTQTYVDMGSISVIPRTTGGQVYYYYLFSALSDPVKLYNDLRWNITRPQGFEAVMRVRCSQEKIWEEEQFRKGLGKRMDDGTSRVAVTASVIPVVQSVQQQQQKFVYLAMPSVSGGPSIGGAIGVSQGLDAMISIPQQAEIAKKALQDNVRRLKESHGRTISSLTKTDENLTASYANITALGKSLSVANEK
ncbi:Protein transport protein Sec24-like, partial [Fagus crenata]